MPPHDDSHIKSEEPEGFEQCDLSAQNSFASNHSPESVASSNGQDNLEMIQALEDWREQETRGTDAQDRQFLTNPKHCLKAQG